MSELFHSHVSDKFGIIKWAAIVCSLPSWVYIASVVYFRFWLDGKFWPHFVWLPIPGVICVLCSVFSMTTFLILLNDSSDARSEFHWFLCAAFPVVLAIVSACFLWFSFTFGRASWGDYYGWD